MASRISPYVDNTGLVFAYDLANVQRSYLGEPTVNIAAGLGLTDLGAGLTYLGIEDGWKKYSMSGTWSGGGYPYSMALDGVSFTGGQPYSVVATLKTNVENKFNYFCADGISYVNQPKDYEGTLSATLNPDGSRTVRRVNFAYTSTTGQLGYLFTNPINGITFNPATDFVYLRAFQAEQKTHPTQFTTGTRSVTQGLKDLTGNSTIDLTNVSFDGNAQMTFDGTDDFATVSGAAVTALTGDMTLNAWYYYNGSTAAPHRTLICTDHSYRYGAKLMSYYHGQRAMWVGSSDGASDYLLAGGAAPTNQWRMLTGTRSTDGTVNLYDNGILIATAQTGKTGTFARAGSVLIGAEYHSNYLGEIPFAQLYNRVLPAPEILQNFNAIKGRYGL